MKKNIGRIVVAATLAGLALTSIGISTASAVGGVRGIYDTHGECLREGRAKYMDGRNDAFFCKQLPDGRFALLAPSSP
ncbi:hypothetical protein FEK33_05450 [Nocardia asteroides NBRC 15531]|uniref:Uncharacterized protein n=1 Tax=Nocardia asteroides NBRC 15531 TaxID=1110697 RepID=U5EBF2_NOCAS|nr:hypothetical protein [Nocardia asteroides]TLF69723.1 hypothetical protein FEK33_05450 [Nocardia asteroides NBRC 15531]UGT49225.1 hypothetical protein LT345_00930 [Nocardia asteroides]SFL84131.1 hypothetical protein SAMN05444423_1011108 [Nocardia asteroides]VEG38467.1 Uncharacterised protein [Nocardia asteroides]GAD83803.1 hypothetical protein NCAST_20_03720 [Nocardia asteroides NBRC 15531]